ncbi:MAG: PQQ-binding-like beta-propeller repeat protein, partial [Phycisphaerae bacterium]
WSAGRIIFLPMDAARVLVLAADDGSLLRSIPVEKLGDIGSLLGVQGDVLCGVGQEVACYDLSADRLHWSTPLPEGADLYGRAVWVDDRLLVPTRHGLSTFRVTDGQRSDVRWDAEGEGGNLLAMPDQLLVAGRRRLSVYVRRTEIWKALQERIAAAPSDPLPALELAEVALSSGEYDKAVAALDEAVRRASHFPEPLEPVLARRLFEDALLFAERLSAHTRLDAGAEKGFSAQRAELLDKLFTYASQYPPDASAHLTYRFRFAELFAKHEQPDRAMRLYQQILRDRSLRELPVDPSVANPDLAGAQARVRIAALIEQYGRSIYAPYEAEARRWLDSGRAADDEATLERLVASFPNSEAAPLALIAHGELLAHDRRAEEAAKRFARAYHRYPKQVDRSALLRKIADAYEAAGKAEHAFCWLTKAAREHPSVRIEDHGRLVSFLEYRERLAHLRDRVEPSRPHIVLPLNEPFVHHFEGNVSLLVPWFGDEPTSRWLRYFTRTQEGIRAFDTRTGRELWPKPAPVRSNAELLIATSDVVVFATLYEVFALDLVTGSRRWSYGEPPRQLDQADGDWEDQDTFRAHSVQDDRLVSVRDNGPISCTAIDTGKLIWSETHRPEPGGRVRLADPWVVYPVTQDERAIICLVDAATGAWSDAIITDEPHTVKDTFVTLDGQIVVATAQSLTSYDPETRKRRWRVPLSGRLRRGSLRLDLDAVYLSENGRHLVKIGLEDGRRLWESERLVPRGDDDLTVDLQGGSVIVSSASSVSAVDAVTGLTLWRGTAPQHPRFVSRLLTRSYVVAVDVSDGLLEADGVAYFYDHRNASGVIAREGGALTLGSLSDVRAVLATDGALLIQTGSTIKGWRHE